MLYVTVLLLCQGAFSIKDVFSPPYMIQPIPTTGPIYFEQEIQEEQMEPSRVCSALEQQRIRQCADPLYAIGALSEDDDSLSFTWGHFVSRTQEYFSQVCDNFYVFDICIEPYKDICFSTDPVRGRYQTAIKVLDFLCRDGYTEMIRNFECFTRTLTRAEMMQCQAEMVADTRKIPNSEEIGPTGQQAAVCGAVRNYVDCIKYPIRYECGYRAWYLVREVIVRPTATLLPQCDISNGNLNRKIDLPKLLMFTLLAFVIL